MHSFPASPANSHYTLRIRPALASFADEVCGTLARLCAYLMTLALMAILRYRAMGTAARCHGDGAVAQKPGARPERTAPAFAVSQLIFPGKTETYEIFRHPEGGRKDVFRWSGIGGTPVAELEIYRPGEEIDQVGSAAGYLAARMDPAGPRELEAAGIIDSKFGAVTLFRRVGGTEAARACLRFYQARRRAEIPPLRLVMPGRRLAGPPHGDRLHAEPADPADGRKRCETGGIVRPCRTQAQRLRDIGRAGLVSGLGDGRR